MKFRLDFVTNSSSSSFAAMCIDSKEIIDLIKEIVSKKDKIYSKKYLGSLFFEGNYLCLTSTADCFTPTTWPLWSLKIDTIYNEKYTEMMRHNDRLKITKPECAYTAIRNFVTRFSAQQDTRLKDLLQLAFDENRLSIDVYMDQTDGFEEKGPFHFRGNKLVKNQIIEDGVLRKYLPEKEERDSACVDESVSQVDPKAFAKFSKLKSVRFSGKKCTLSSGVFSNKTELEEIVFPVDNTEIEEGVCSGCVNLKKVVLPEAVDEIKDRAFCGCTELEEIALPDSVVFIGARAFADCKKLKHIVLPKNILFVNPTAFVGCITLQQQRKDFLEEVSKCNDERKLVNELQQAVAYIKENGYKHYWGSYLTWDQKYNWGCISTRKWLEDWHKKYDSEFDIPDAIYINGVTFSVYADFDDRTSFLTHNKTIFSEIGWQYRQDISGKTNYLLVNTEQIPKKLLQGASEGTPFHGAILRKKAGQEIWIISIQTFTKAVQNKSFLDYEEYKQKKNKEAQLAAQQQREQQKKEQVENRKNKLKQEADSALSCLKHLCEKNGCRFKTLSSIHHALFENGFSFSTIKTVMIEPNGFDPQQFFLEQKILLSSDELFSETIEMLKKYYEDIEKPKSILALEKEHPDLTWNMIYSGIAQIGKSPYEFFVEQGIISKKDLSISWDTVKYKPGEEPVDIKVKLDRFFGKLDDKYPDKIIQGLYNKYKELGKKATELYRLLGYADLSSFLRAYGYIIPENRGGRPSKK